MLLLLKEGRKGRRGAGMSTSIYVRLVPLRNSLISRLIRGGGQRASCSTVPHILKVRKEIDERRSQVRKVVAQKMGATSAPFLAASVKKNTHTYHQFAFYVNDDS